MYLKKEYTIKEIAQILKIKRVIGSDLNKISSLKKIEFAKKNDITFLINYKHLKFIDNIKAGAIITYRVIEKCQSTQLITKNPKLILSKLILMCKKYIKDKKKKYGIHYSAIIGKNCKISNKIFIGPNCILKDNVIINDFCRLESNVFIGKHSQLGRNVVLLCNVVINDYTILGNYCTIKENSTIGGNGFGYALDKKLKWKKIYHLGKVIIKNKVEIGSNVTIDKGIIDDTLIESNVIIDNQVHIGHNTKIKKNTAIAGCVGIAGSVKIGKSCLIGGKVGISDNIEIADNVTILASSNVTKSIEYKGIYSSVFKVENVIKWNRNLIYFYNLKKIMNKISKLENFLKYE